LQDFALGLSDMDFFQQDLLFGSKFHIDFDHKAVENRKAFVPAGIHSRTVAAFSGGELFRLNTKEL